MSFMLRDGWYCQFLEADLKTPLPRKFTFATPDVKGGAKPDHCGGVKVGQRRVVGV